MDWNKVWSKKYPILSTYKQEVQKEFYEIKLKELLAKLRKDYGYSDVEACLVLKDILAQVWKF